MLVWIETIQQRIETNSTSSKKCIFLISWKQHLTLDILQMLVYLKANCLVCMQRESDALDCFKEAIGRYCNISHLYYENMSVGRIFMGEDHNLMTSYDANACLKKSKIIFENFSLNPDKNENIAAVMGIKFCGVLIFYLEI